MPEIDVDSYEPFQWAIQSFTVDRVTAEVVTELRAASIPTILLKGPTLATWLYSGDRPRPYADTDLLVRRSDWRATMDLLQRLGFVDALGLLSHPRMEAGDGYPWVRTDDGAEVDLHHTLYGIGAEPDEFWQAFSEGSSEEPVGGIRVAMPSHPARLLHVALHAVQHGGNSSIERKPIRDLEQALDRADRSQWEEARELAERLRALPMLAQGLRLHPDGERLSDELGLARGHSVDASVRMAEVPLAEGFKELAETRGLRARVALVVRELFPSREFMRWWSPIARRGPLGMAAAYVGRPFLMARRALPGYLAWRRARRRSED